MNIIFDWSGTLADDFTTTWEMTNLTLRQFGGRPVDKDTYRRDFCIPVNSFYDTHCPGGYRPELDDFFFEEYLKQAADLPLFPGISEWINTLSEFHQLFVLSTVDSRAIQKCLDARGLSSRFSQIAGNAFDKRIALPLLIKKNSLRRHDTLFIGDTPHDILSGKEAKIRTAGVGYGYTPSEILTQAAPDYFFETIAGMREAVDNLRKAESSKHPIITVGGLIFNSRGQALFVQTEKWSNLYGTPGGKVERGETLVEAFEREIKEETDLDITGIRFIFYQDCVDHPEFYKPMHFVLMNYVARCVSEEVLLNYESMDYRWWTLDEALAKPLNQPTLRLVEELKRRPGEFV